MLVIFPLVISFNKLIDLIYLMINRAFLFEIFHSDIGVKYKRPFIQPIWLIFLTLGCIHSTLLGMDQETFIPNFVLSLWFGNLFLIR